MTTRATRTRDDRTRPIVTRRDRVTTAYAAGLGVAEIAAELHLDPLTVAEIIDQDRRPCRHVTYRPGYGGCGPNPPPLSWCAGCGALVEQPCRLCRTRRLTAAGPLPHADEVQDDQGEEAPCEFSGRVL
jgi:hypothetical protein